LRFFLLAAWLILSTKLYRNAAVADVGHNGTTFPVQATSEVISNGTDNPSALLDHDGKNSVIKVNPLVDALRSDPGFSNLIARMNPVP